MERRRAVTIAAATVATGLGAVAAVAANFGLLGLGTAASDTVGQLDAGRVAEVVTPAASPSAAATGPSPNVTVRYEDIYLSAPAASGAPATPSPVGGASLTTAVGDTGAVTAEEPGPADGGYETDENDDDHHRESGDHEDEEEEEEADD